LGKEQASIVGWCLRLVLVQRRVPLMQYQNPDGCPAAFPTPGAAAIAQLKSETIWALEGANGYELRTLTAVSPLSNQLEQAAIAQLRSETIEREDEQQDDEGEGGRDQDFSDLQVGTCFCMVCNLTCRCHSSRTSNTASERVELSAILQVLLHSSEDFGPATIRNLTVSWFFLSLAARLRLRSGCLC